MLEAGVIGPPQSESARPIVIVPRQDGTPRFCVDYRRRNLVTVKDSYPIPRFNDCIDSLRSASISTTIDCNCGYWQIPIPKEDQDKTAFRSHVGTFCLLRMPFGLLTVSCAVLWSNGALGHPGSVGRAKGRIPNERGSGISCAGVAASRSLQDETGKAGKNVRIISKEYSGGFGPAAVVVHQQRRLVPFGGRRHCVRVVSPGAESGREVIWNCL